MASSTYTINQSIVWAGYFLGNRPFALTNNEPALTSANLVIQIMTQPPFKWRWNRGFLVFNLSDPAGWTANTLLPVGYCIIDSNNNIQSVTVSGTTGNSSHPAWATTANTTTADNTVTWTTTGQLGPLAYETSIANFGWLESAHVAALGSKQTAYPASFTSSSLHQINFTKSEITDDYASGRPQTISPLYDDNNGNIYFQFLPGIPDKLYGCKVTYQKSLGLFTDPSVVWGIPDRYSYVYNLGFLGFMMLFANDGRAQGMLSMFKAAILSLQDGLTAEEKNAFLEQWNLTVQQARASAMATQGIGGRAV